MEDGGQEAPAPGKSAETPAEPVDVRGVITLARNAQTGQLVFNVEGALTNGEVINMAAELMAIMQTEMIVLRLKAEGRKPQIIKPGLSLVGR